MDRKNGSPLRFHGLTCRQRRFEEVRTLKALGTHEHILELIDSWEQYDHLFIQTELCENGSLDVFLRDYGNIERLEEFRVWKILLELSLVLLLNDLLFDNRASNTSMIAIIFILT